MELKKIIESKSFSFDYDRYARNLDFPTSLVVYLETVFSPNLNRVIQKNLPTIEKIYADAGKTFVYLPALLLEMTDLLPYFKPLAVIDETVTSQNITPIVTTKLFAELNISTDCQGGMLLTRTGNGNTMTLTPLMVKGFTMKAFLIEHASLSKIWDNRKYSTVLTDDRWPDMDDTPSKDPELHFNEDIARIVSEIDERIRYLKEKGLFHLLSETIAPMLLPQLSRLHITDDYRIFLPDYRNMEIKMNPLSKTVYFLFLCNPWGISLNSLSYYHCELTEIYRLVSGQSNLDDMAESIRRLADPSDNSIYEKCSRIKRAFLQDLSDDIAKNYYVFGEINEPKRISLSRSLVEIPDALKNISNDQRITRQNMDIISALIKGIPNI